MNVSLRARGRVEKALEEAKTVEELEKEHWPRISRILKAAQKAKSVRELRKLSGIWKDYFPLYYNWLKDEHRKYLKQVSTGRGRALKHEVTEKGSEALRFMSSSPLGKKIVFEMDGWARGKVELTLKAPTEVWRAVKHVVFGAYHFLRFLSTSPPSRLGIELEINPILETLEDDMWSFIVHSAINQCPAGRERWWQAIEYRLFKLPDCFGMPVVLKRLKEEYSAYWTKRLDERWIPSCVRELAPNRIKRVQDENEKRKLEEKLRWIHKQLEMDPNTFMPSPLWRKLGFDVRCVWPAEVSLPFNVTIPEPKMFAFLIYLYDTLRDVSNDPMIFTLPFEMEKRVELFGKKYESYLIGSPAPFIKTLQKLQRDSTFYEAWSILLKINDVYEKSRIFYPIHSAYKRHASLGVFVDIARAYTNIWKNASGKKKTDREIILAIKKICREISEGKYDYV